MNPLEEVVYMDLSQAAKTFGVDKKGIRNKIDKLRNAGFEVKTIIWDESGKVKVHYPQLVRAIYEHSSALEAARNSFL